MLFNSIPFLVFFLIVFFIYWFIFSEKHRFQNSFLLISCYVFYGWWNWHFLILLIPLSLISYILGHYIGKTDSQKKKSILLYSGVIVSLMPLIYYKYTHFFTESFVSLLSKFNFQLSAPAANIILPLGISFYTFRLLSYLFDVNNGKIEPVSNWIVFCTHIAFFPSLIAGPIDRAGTLIPQLQKKRVFDYAQAADGMRQILWGLFKKIAIADRCATIVNPIFDDYEKYPGSTIFIGIFFYTIQIYADFSGYSDMAIGIARLLGFNITRNFDYPYFSQTIAEFWRRWHISLTTWLTDYVFIPASLAFREYRKWGLILAILLTFLVSGLWHGANWTFVAWGLLYGCYFIPLILQGKLNKKIAVSRDKLFPSLREMRNMAGIFFLVMIVNVFFRSDSLNQAIEIYKKLISPGMFSIPSIRLQMLATFVLALIMFTAEWLQRDKPHPLQINFVKNANIRISIYYTIILLILFFAGASVTQFIYFKF